MNRPIMLCAIAAYSLSVVAQTAVSLSFDAALQQMERASHSLQIAEREIRLAQAERNKLRATWLPALQGVGSYVHLSEKIEVRQSLAPLTDAVKEFAGEVLPEAPFIGSLLDQIGSYTLAFPLAPRNLSTVGLSAEWVLFSGGKRIRASHIGNSLVGMARENRRQVDARQRTLLAESYFGLRLAQEVESVRRETFRNLQQHYQDALKLEAVGMIDKASRLFAQVNMDEAEREWKASRKEVEVLQSALCVLLQLPDSSEVVPTSPLFIGRQLPAKELFVQQMQVESPVMNRLKMQSDIAGQQLRIEQSGYLPDVALFGKQTLYSHGIASNLLPRTMVGIGFTWNLFDGLAREQRISQAKINRESLRLARSQAEDELSVGINELYARLQKSQDNVQTLDTTIALSEELLRMRRKSFAEGMATATEVIDAETMLAQVRTARLAACYEYDVSLMQLLALCGAAESFQDYFPH